MTPTMRAKALRFTQGTGFAYVVVIAALLVGVYFNGRHDSRALRDSQVAGCERGARDRFDHASVYRAMAGYYDGVVHAASVKADIKHIATGIRDELLRAADSQTSRILLCVPLIDEHRELPDLELLSQLPPLHQP